MTCNPIMMIIEKIITDNMAITNMASKGRHIAKKKLMQFFTPPHEKSVFSSKTY